MMGRPAFPPPDAIMALVNDEGLIALRVTPNAKAEAIIVEQGQLKVRVTVVPEDGKANKAVVALLAKALGIAKSRVTIVRGETARDKLVRVGE